MLHEFPGVLKEVTMAAQIKDPNDHPDQTYIDEDHGEGYEGEDE